MNDGRFDRQSSLDALASFTSEPPPPGEGADVHSARTAVATLPDSFLADLRRGKADDPTTARYKVLPESGPVDREAATLPPPVTAPSETRVRELNAAISAALNVALPCFEPAPDAYAPPSAGAIRMPSVERAGLPSTAVPAQGRPANDDDDRWVLLVLAVAIVAALLAGGIPAILRG